MNPNQRIGIRRSLACAALALLGMTALSSAQTDARLSNLVPSVGTLTPVFDSGTTGYTATSPFATDSITVTPTAADPGATIKVDNTQGAYKEAAVGIHYLDNPGQYAASGNIVASFGNFNSGGGTLTMANPNAASAGLTEIATAGNSVTFKHQLNPARVTLVSCALSSRV
jgi:hypothetical protein